MVWTGGPCVFEQGSMHGSLDGGLSPAAGTRLPPGSHTYVASFANCLVEWWGVELNGTASAAYTAAEWSHLTATVSADSVRGKGLAFLSELRDVTADGSGAWTQAGSSTKSWSYTPASGSRLVNNLTSNVATFRGGSYSEIQYPAPPGTSAAMEQRFDNLQVDINGTQYILTGSLDSRYGFVGGQATHTGEIRITSNGTLVARIYGGVPNGLAIEVLVPVAPL